jgi:hypothetical protein
MKRIAFLFLGMTAAATGCLNMQTMDTMPQPAAVAVEPAPPPVLPGQVTETNAAEVTQALNDELDHANVERSVPPAPGPGPSALPKP